MNLRYYLLCIYITLYQSTSGTLKLQASKLIIEASNSASNARTRELELEILKLSNSTAGQLFEFERLRTLKLKLGRTPKLRASKSFELGMRESLDSCILTLRTRDFVCRTFRDFLCRTLTAPQPRKLSGSKLSELSNSQLRIDVAGDAIQAWGVPVSTPPRFDSPPELRKTLRVRVSPCSNPTPLSFTCHREAWHGSQCHRVSKAGS